MDQPLRALIIGFCKEPHVTVERKHLRTDPISQLARFVEETNVI